MIGSGEVWDRAVAVERLHGNRSEIFVLERIAACQRKGRAEAASFWQDVENVLRDIQQIHRPLA